MLCLALSDLLEGVMLTCGCLSQLFICMHMRDIILLLEQGILMAEEGYQTSLFFLLFKYFFYFLDIFLKICSVLAVANSVLLF